MTKKRACRCLGPEKPHDEGELPGCMYPADPADRRIENEINGFGPRVLDQLHAWQIYTLGDLAKHGGVHEMPVPDSEAKPGGWRLYYPPLLDISGIGVQKILRIRLALREHGLALADEETLNQWQPLP